MKLSYFKKLTLIYYIFFLFILQIYYNIHYWKKDQFRRGKFIAREGIILKLQYKYSCMFYFRILFHIFFLTFAYNISIVLLYHHSQNTPYIFDSISIYILAFSHYIRVVPKCKGNILCIREAYLWRLLKENFKKIFFLHNFLFEIFMNNLWVV